MQAATLSSTWIHHKHRCTFIAIMTISIFVWVSVGVQANSGNALGYQAIHHHFMMQTIGLGLALACIVYMYKYFFLTTKTYLRIGNLTSYVRAEPMIHLRPRRKDHWTVVGIDGTIIVAVVSILMMHVPRIVYNGLQVDMMVKILPIAIVFSFINSFTEEILMRLGLIVSLKGVVSERKIPLICGLIYGCTQYWSAPGGFLGVITGIALGWFLAKSVLETRGLFWAWLIHFVRDVVVYSSFFSLSFAA